MGVWCMVCWILVPVQVAWLYGFNRHYSQRVCINSVQLCGVRLYPLQKEDRV